MGAVDQDGHFQDRRSKSSSPARARDGGAESERGTEESDGGLLQRINATASAVALERSDPKWRVKDRYRIIP